MKTLGRILIILAVFSFVMGIMYVVVNAGSSGSSGGAPQFDRPFPSDEERPALPDGQRPDFREGSGFGWIAGAVKNIGIIAIVVALIVVPKGWMEKRRKAAQA
jgi:hypothetical protein